MRELKHAPRREKGGEGRRSELFFLKKIFKGKLGVPIV